MALFNERSRLFPHDLFKKTVSGDGVAGRRPYGVITRLERRAEGARSGGQWLGGGTVHLEARGCGRWSGQAGGRRFVDQQKLN